MPNSKDQFLGRALLPIALLASISTGVVASNYLFVYKVNYQSPAEIVTSWAQFYSNNPHLPDPGDFSSLNWSSQSLTEIPNGDYPFNQVPGGINLEFNSISNVDGLSNVTRVGGDLRFGTNNLTDITGLSSLERVDGSLHILKNQITNVDSLENLTYVGGNLFLYDNELTDLNGIRNISTVWAFFYVSGNGPTLTDVSGLANLTTLGHSVVVIDPPGAVNSDPTKFNVRAPAASNFCQKLTSGDWRVGTSTNVSDQLPNSMVCEEV